jgi:hypothetical protein
VDLDTNDIGSLEIGEQPDRPARWFVRVTLEKKDKGKKSRGCADPKPIRS